MNRLVVATLSIFLAGTSLAGCAASVDVPSASCDAAAAEALEQEQVLHDTHPLWAADVPGADTTDEQWAEYDALEADEEAQWTAIYDVVYTECESPADWWVTARKYPGIAGVTSEEFLEPEMLRDLCVGHESASACQELDEWLATSPG